MGRLRQLPMALSVSTIAVLISVTAFGQGPNNGSVRQNKALGDPGSSGNGADEVRRYESGPSATGMRNELLSLEVGEQRVIPSEGVQSLLNGIKHNPLMRLPLAFWLAATAMSAAQAIRTSIAQR